MQGPMGISAPDTIEELKLVIVGDSDVGKTSLCMRYCHGAAVAVSPTIGASFLQKRTSVAEDVSEIRSSGGDSGNVDADEKGVVKTEVVMQLWDTAGQERFRSMAPMYYRNAKAAFIVFDLSKGCSVQKLERWRQDLLQFADDGVVIALLGNKCDVQHSKDLSEAKSYCESIGAPLFETSAFTGEGVEAAFSYLAKGALQLRRRTLASDMAARRATAERLRLDQARRQERQQGCC